MSDNTTIDTDLEDTTGEVATPDVNATKEEFDKGTWQYDVKQSSVLFKRSGDAKKRASTLLWTGATAAISEWEAKSDTDVNGEGLANDLLFIMGTARKGDVSKIKTVALAVRNNGLDTSAWPNLSKAYGEAIRLTKTAVVERAEDTAGEEAIAAVTAEAPKTATTVEGSVRVGLALAGDFDEFFKVFCDVVENGGQNPAALRSALRSLADEVGGRNKPVAAAPTQGAGNKPAQATTTPAATATKAAPGKPRKAASATPQSVSKGDANKKALPPKTKPVDTEADIFDEVEGEAPAPAKPAPAKPAPAKPRRA